MDNVTSPELTAHLQELHQNVFGNFEQALEKARSGNSQIDEVEQAHKAMDQRLQEELGNADDMTKDWLLSEQARLANDYAEVTRLLEQGADA